MPISTFDPFSSKKAAEYSRTGTQIQEAVHYAESRFRAILTDINNDLNKSEIDRKNWIQTLLRRELVSISCKIIVKSDPILFLGIYIISYRHRFGIGSASCRPYHLAYTGRHYYTRRGK